MKEELNKLKNNLPVKWVIQKLLLRKEIEGDLRFLCPLCQELQTYINPRENLARCFRCKKNLNPIDLMMAEKDLNFLAAIEFLQNTFQPDTLADQQLELASDLKLLLDKLTEHFSIPNTASVDGSTCLEPPKSLLN